MRKGLPFAVAACMALIAAGPAAAQPPAGIVRPTYEPSTPSLELGQELFAGNCASCHGIAGSGLQHPRPGFEGIMGEGPRLKGVGALAADLYLRSGYMPLGNPRDEPQAQRPWFDNVEIESLVGYVASLGTGPAIPRVDPRAGSLSEGFNLFIDHCSGCHQALAEGGYVTGARVPPLHTVPAEQIAEAVRVGPYLMPHFTTEEISDSQLNSIIRYIRYTSQPDNRGGWGIGELGPIPEGLVTWWIAIPLLLVACLAVSRRRRT